MSTDQDLVSVCYKQPFHREWTIIHKQRQMLSLRSTTFTIHSFVMGRQVSSRVRYVFITEGCSDTRRRTWGRAKDTSTRATAWRFLSTRMLYVVSEMICTSH